MNKGLEIRNKKLINQTKKRNTIKSDQESICRFVTIHYSIIEKVYGKYKKIGEESINGLQIKNRVYLLKGSYKLINSKSVHITAKYPGIPDWASEELIDRYNTFNKVSK